MIHREIPLAPAAQLNRRGLLKGLSGALLASATLGTGNIFASTNTAPAKHGTLTGHCIDSLEFGLELGASCLRRGLFSLKEIHASEFLIQQSQYQRNQVFRREYNSLDVVQINGWTLARSEAHYYAGLASRTQT